MLVYCILHRLLSWRCERDLSRSSDCTYTAFSSRSEKYSTERATLMAYLHRQAEFVELTTYMVACDICQKHDYMFQVLVS